MAEVLKNFSFGRNPRGSYDKYLDGQIWKVTLADVPSTTIRGARTTLLDKAKRKGLIARTRLTDNDTAIVVQAFNADGSLIVQPIRQVV